MTSRISGWCTTPATGRFTASVRLLGYVDCLSRVPGDWYARFCGEGVIAISSPHPTNYGAHLVAIRTFQGREAELADLAASIATSPTLIERECAFGFAATLFALRAGRPQQAQALLDRLRRDGLGPIPLSSSWLLAMLAVVELAAALEDSSIAQAAYDALCRMRSCGSWHHWR